VDRFNKIINSVSRVLNDISGVSLALVVVVVTYNTIARRTFVGPFLGTYEFASYLTGISMALALAWNQLKRVNIEVDLVIGRLSKRGRAIISCIINPIAIILFLVVTWSLFQYGFETMENKEVSWTMNWPFYPEVFVTGLCFLLLSLVLFVQFLKSLQEVRQS
jgi:TRAP-type C4-dicarboxylate transport system permease small subunit